MIELGYETISGTPGTSASLTLAAVTSPVAFPRMSAVAALNTPIIYTIENSSGQTLCSGVGLCTAAGSFTRVRETSSWNGTTYNRDPGTFADLPSGCVIYCGLTPAQSLPAIAPHQSQHWFEPGRFGVAGQTIALTASRDHFWRLVNLYPWPIDAVAMHMSASGNLDFGIYTINPSDGKPLKLLLGWQNATMAIGMNTLTLASATLGALSATPQPLPTGDLMCMLNPSSGNIGRVCYQLGNVGGSDVADLTNPGMMMYVNRTQGTSFGDAPSVTRTTTGWPNFPMIPFRAE